MATNKRLMGLGAAAAAAATFTPSEHFNTVLYTGNGGTQRIGGYINRGAVFNGSSSYIDLGNNSSNNGSLISVSCWFQTSSTASEGMVWNNGANDSQSTGLALSVKSPGVLFFQANTLTTFVNDTGTTTVNDGDWHHVVVNYDNGDFNVYLDGNSTPELSGTSSAFTTTANRNFLIGRLSRVATAYFDGVIDQFRIFNRELTTSEVTTLYGETHSSTTISTTDIFSDDSGVALYQLDGNANDTGVPKHYLFVSDAGGNSTSVRLNSVDSEFTYTRPVGYDEWGGAFDPNNKYESGTITLSESNKKFDKSGSFYNSILSANNYNTGKYYFELEFLAADLVFGLTRLDTAADPFTNDWYNNSILFKSWSATGHTYSTSSISNFGQVLSTNDVIGIRANFDLGFIEYYVNNTLVEQVVLQGYDGTATNITYQEATKFSPDLIWIKQRTGSVANHLIFDSVRGEHKQLMPNTTSSGVDRTSVDKGVTSFDSNGFTVKDTSAGDYEINGPNGGTYSGDGTYVAWCFNAGSGSETSGTGTGSITNVAYKANTDSGFSIVKYTGSGSVGTVTHGLNSKPDLIIFKNLEATGTSDAWPVYSTPTTADYSLYLYANYAAIDDANNFNDTEPTDSVFTVGTWNGINKSGINFIAYCFHDVAGYQKIGSYDGTGAAGNMVETGFEPAFLLIKQTNTSGSNWNIIDNKRDTENPRDVVLWADTSDTESTASQSGVYDVNFLSNGFSLENTYQPFNASGGTYIYLAIAADPDTTTPTVADSFDVVTYSGTNSTQSINVDFKPDLIWFKNRTGTNSHAIIDSVRGRAKSIYPDDTFAENTSGASNDLVSFDDNGFTVGSVSQSGSTNASGGSIVAWCWKAGDHDDNLPQINENGDISSVTSVNDASGFSIVKYTGNGGSGQSVGHGLSSAPEIVIFKRTDASVNWFVFVKVGGVYKRLEGLNTTSAATSVSSFSASSTTITWSGTTSDFNGSGNEYIMYCWYSVSGHSKIGSYDIDSSDPQTITTGFQPRFVMLKNINYSGGSWYIYDNLRRDSAEYGYRLFANSANAESASSAYDLDFTSNGFTVQGTGILSSGSSSYDGNTVIYMAFK